MKSTEVTEALTKQKLRSQRKIIQTKTNEITKLLIAEKIENPLELGWKAQKIFEKTRKEIVNIIWNIKKLGWDTSKYEARKRKFGPFSKSESKETDINNPRIQEIKKYLDGLYKGIEDRKKITPEEWNASMTR